MSSVLVTSRSVGGGGGAEGGSCLCIITNMNVTHTFVLSNNLQLF